MVALLDLMRENEAVKDTAGPYQAVLRSASVRLKILDPVHGDQELIKSVAVVMAKLSLLPRKP